MAMVDSDDDSDDWATEELPGLSSSANTTPQPPSSVVDVDDDEEGWERKIAPPKSKATTEKSQNPDNEGEPMILIDMTIFSNDEIHSKFDPNSVNDTVAMKQLREKIENDYEKYSKDASLLADGTVIPCGSSVWRPALERMRRERPGHYFAPVFPPAKKK